MDRVVIAGATGFVGRALAAALAPHYDVVGLTRSAWRAEQQHAELGIRWVSCDLFSLKDAELALEGARYAFYLVHSMAPSARLTQANFADLDLLIADNFTRAAARAGVEQILYLGGIIPQDCELSAHLESRLEVERALASRGVPLTALRAGLVIGAGGSSFEILYNLVDRLPVLAAPSWTRTWMTPVGLDDVVAAFVAALGNAKVYGMAGDLGGPDELTYETLIRKTAELMGRKRTFVRVPFPSPGLSRYWVQLITGAPGELVGPLVKSLKCPMRASRFELQRELGITPAPVDAVLCAALREERELQQQEAPVVEKPASLKAAPKKRRKDVRSVQRLPMPPGRDARWVAERYMRWLPNAMRPFVRVRVFDEERAEFRLLALPWPLLVLSRSHDRSLVGRELFYITGGVLADLSRSLRGRLEFREALDGRAVIAAIHEFTPALPWWLYRWTQALVHGWVMAAFGRYLARESTRRELPGKTSPRPVE